MASSGTYSFNLDVDEIIREASEMLGGEQVLGNELTSAKRSINLILTDWQNRGVNLWTVSTTAVSVASSTTVISLEGSTIDVLEAVWQVSTNQELQMNRISMEEYLTYSNKSRTGRPNEFAVRRNRDNVDVYLYPVPDTDTGAFKYEKFGEIQDVTNTAVENVDVPKRFLPCLTAGLAFYMGLKRPNVDMNRLNMLKVNYEELFTNASEEDRERTSLYFRPKLRRI